jgi:formylglycine-generating enzyme required for sulfatase activity
MKLLHSLLCLLAAGATAFAALPVVSNVTSTQRAGTKFVDITYDVADADGDALKVRVEISDNNGATYAVPAFTFSGAIGDNVIPGTGKTIAWNAGQDWDGEYSTQMRVKVIAVDAKGLPGLAWSKEIPPGGFLMGQDGGVEGSGLSRHVNIPWSYWLSKFEITNDQYAEYLNTALVAGAVTRVSTTSVTAVVGKYTGVPASGLLLQIGDTYDIRWNVNKFDAVAGRGNFPVSVTWYGAVAFAQHYGYDLPTQAEWEKAARGPDYDDAGQHQLYPWGNSINGGYANYKNSRDIHEIYNTESYWSYNMLMNSGKSPVGYYNGNQTPLGPDSISAYGIYDLGGNLSEWTRSVFLDISTYPQAEDLASPHNSISSADASRIAKGGDHVSDTQGLAIYNRVAIAKGTYISLGGSVFPDFTSRYGFRVIRRSTP